MTKRARCPVCSYTKKKIPPLLPIVVKDEAGQKKEFMLCPECLTFWRPDEIHKYNKRKKDV
ncbi:MAG: hypothetical protein J7M18_01370 [Candidatus Eremiobacteraeota bacterium]|nr:hypothetical protein [Candidatus Eremiobacteraeota bacterium]